jgi:adenylate cyclase class IV
MKKTSSIFFFFYKETRSFCSNVDDIEGVGFFLTNINSSYQQQEAASNQTECMATKELGLKRDKRGQYRDWGTY